MGMKDMRMRNVWNGMLALGMIWVTGCGGGGGRGRQPRSVPVARYIRETPPADLSKQDVAAAALILSDPDRVVLAGTYLPLILGIEAHLPDQKCPEIVDQSDMAAGRVDWRIRGGCTAMDGSGTMTRYEGEIVARGDEGSTVIQYEDFRLVQTLDCNGTPVETVVRWEGEVQVPFAFLLGGEPAEPEQPAEPMNGAGYPAGQYDVAILLEVLDVDQACNRTRLGLAYDARIDVQVENGGGAFTRNILQMEGHAARRDSAPPAGDPGPVGSWELSADDYTEAAAVCSSEPLQGALTVRADGHEATIRPDGATSCAALDEPPCAPWSHDGQAQPAQLCDYTGCSAGPDAPPPWIALAILLAGLLWQRRRTRRARALGPAA
jgi:MYXO-CTERM domain-containing protein